MIIGRGGVLFSTLLDYTGFESHLSCVNAHPQDSRTSKIGCHCTAYIRAQKYLSGEVYAEICNHHTHPIELGHLKLPDSVREKIAAKLSDGVTISVYTGSRERQH